MERLVLENETLCGAVYEYKIVVTLFGAQNKGTAI